MLRLDEAVRADGSAGDMKRIGVLTSGGDAPGMNAAIRAVVRTALDEGCETFGVRRGYAGLLDGDVIPLGDRDVSGILQRGGTMLSSARAPEFRDVATQKRGLAALSHAGIDALVVIGGNGSQTGAAALSQLGLPVVGVSSTIDNDLHGADITIGVDSALNVALEAIDRLKVTASSHRRAFLVEVMGRDSGYLALASGIAGGAESVVLPEVPADPEKVAADVRAAYDRGKAHAIVVVAEGAAYDADALVTYFAEHRARLGFELRATILGHVQRGASPGAFDRLLASRLGHAAALRLVRGEHGVLVGLVRGAIVGTPLAEVAATKKRLDLADLELARRLAR